MQTSKNDTIIIIFNWGLHTTARQCVCVRSMIFRFITFDRCIDVFYYVCAGVWAYGTICSLNFAMSLDSYDKSWGSRSRLFDKYTFAHKPNILKRKLRKWNTQFNTKFNIFGGNPLLLLVAISGFHACTQFIHWCSCVFFTMCELYSLSISFSIILCWVRNKRKHDTYDDRPHKWREHDRRCKQNKKIYKKIKQKKLATISTVNSSSHWVIWWKWRRAKT